MKRLRRWYNPELKSKRCSKCGQWKNLVDFNKNSTKKDGYDYQCKTCVSNRQEKYYQEHTEEIKKKTGKYYRKKNPKKRCPRCKRLRNITCYYKDLKRDDGLMRWCKYCYDMITKGDLDDINKQIYSIRHYKKNRPEILTKAKEYRKRNPLKIQANNAVEKALREGKLIKPEMCSNPKCPKKGAGRMEAHHESYEKEKWLEVIWLCSSCHKQIHSSYIERSLLNDKLTL